MNCNGDVRLATLSPQAEQELRLMGLTQIFELHPTTKEAVQSYYRRRYSVAGMTDRTTIQDVAVAA